jgi:hypothetical protein
MHEGPEFVEAGSHGGGAARGSSAPGVQRHGGIRDWLIDAIHAAAARVRRFGGNAVPRFFTVAGRWCLLMLLMANSGEGFPNVGIDAPRVAKGLIEY